MLTASRLLLVCLSPLALAGVSHAGAQFSPTESRSVHPYAQFQTPTDTINWYWLNPRPTGARLFDVTFADPSTAIAVGHGTIIRSTTAGYNWEQVASPTMGFLKSVSFADPLTGVAVGDGGMIYGTNDGGITWTSQSSGTTANLTGVSMADPLNATAINDGGLIIRTVDGGVNWTFHSANPGLVLNDVDFGGPLNGLIAASGGTVLITTDGGETWNPRVLNSDIRFRAVDMTDPRNGTAVGGGDGYMGDVFGMMYRTKDGGATWSRQAAYWSYISFSMVAFADSSVGMVVGFDDFPDNFILSTPDAGETWNEISPTPAYRGARHGIAFGDPQTAVLVGGGGQVYRLNPDGWSWDARHRSSFEETLNDVFFTSAHTGVVVGADGIYRTVDGGSTWENYVSGVNVVDVSFTDALHGVAIGNSLFLRTTDGGLSWTTRDVGIPLTAVSFVDDQIGFVASRSTGNVLRTLDGGSSWNRVLVTSEPVDLYFVDQTIGACLESVSEIQMTYDLGDSWNPINIPGPGELLAVCFDDAGNGTIAGEGGKLVRSTDRGVTWTPLSSGTTVHLWDVAFSNELTGIAAGGNTVIRTVDGGASWDVQQFGSLGVPQAFNGVDASGRVVGKYGVVLSPTPPGPPPTVSPVIIGFAGIAGFNYVDLSWRAEPLFDVVGFRIHRIGEGSPDSWLPDTGILSPETTDYRDITVVPHRAYDYTLVAYLTSGQEDRSGPVHASVPGEPLFSTFNATTTNRHVDLSWSVLPNVGIEGFRLLRNDYGSSDVWLPDSLLLDPTVTSFRDTTVNEGADYRYTLFAYFSGRVYYPSDPLPVTVATWPTIDTVVASPAHGGVRVWWQVTSGQYVSGYDLLRQSQGRDDITTLHHRTRREYLDEDVDPDREYTYTLTANVSYGGEIVSSPVFVTTMLPGLTRFDAEAETDRVTLNWEIDSNIALEGFHLIRSRSGHGDVRIPRSGRFPPTERSIVDHDLTPGVEYAYTLVVSVMIGGEYRSQPLPVSTVPFPIISQFNATSVMEEIRLDWEVDSEDIVRGYRFGRYCHEDGTVWIPADTLLPPGTQSLIDEGVVVGRGYTYTLWVQLTMPGVVTSPDVEVTADQLPTSYALGQNQPNPFNPTTLIPYALPERARVTLEVYDTAGRRLRVIADEEQDPGYRSYEWDGLNDAGAAVASGVYFYRLRADSFSATRKMVLVR